MIRAKSFVYASLLIASSACSNAEPADSPESGLSDGGTWQEMNSSASGSDDAGATPIEPETVTHDNDANVASGSCDHMASFIPSTGMSTLAVGQFCDVVSVSFDSLEEAEQAQAVDDTLDCCSSAAFPECTPVTTCSWSPVHTIDRAELDRMCAVFDAVPGAETAECVVFL